VNAGSYTRIKYLRSTGQRLIRDERDENNEHEAQFSLEYELDEEDDATY